MEKEERRRSPGAYHEIAAGGRVTPVGIVPPFGSGFVDYFHVILSLGSYELVEDVILTIVRNDGSDKPTFPKTIDVRRGRREWFGPLNGGNNRDVLAIVDLEKSLQVYELVSWWSSMAPHNTERRHHAQRTEIRRLKDE